MEHSSTLWNFNVNKPVQFSSIETTAVAQRWRRLSRGSWFVFPAQKPFNLPEDLMHGAFRKGFINVVLYVHIQSTRSSTDAQAYETSDKAANIFATVVKAAS